ncbi:MAG: hypothetical protein FWE11_05475 [Defluviitaleaceae bacterium]|nr:hypothetical protein [Defluviitaleaceae bacterium]
MELIVTWFVLGVIFVAVFISLIYARAHSRRLSQRHSAFVRSMFVKDKASYLKMVNDSIHSIDSMPTQYKEFVPVFPTVDKKEME